MRLNWNSEAGAVEARRHRDCGSEILSRAERECQKQIAAFDHARWYANARAMDGSNVGPPNQFSKCHPIADCPVARYRSNAKLSEGRLSKCLVEVDRSHCSAVVLQNQITGSYGDRGMHRTIRCRDFNDLFAREGTRTLHYEMQHAVKCNVVLRVESNVYFALRRHQRRFK